MKERKGINRNELLKEIQRILDNIEIPVKVQSDIINQMIDNTYHDMNLKMDILEHSVRFFMFERGEIVFEKNIDDEQVIKYIILENVINIYFNRIAGEKAVMFNGYIDMRWIKKAKEDIFVKVGEPYLTMYSNDISIYNV